jgi:hypothetical protein
MHSDTHQIASHMKDFGLHAFGRSIVDVVFCEITNPYAHAMGVIRCAHAAELLIKARIAEEHPLLIFEKLPRPKGQENKLLDINTLLNEGRTIMYSDLPDLLWAATGQCIRDIERYQSFGRLRNAITHLGIPDANLSHETLLYGFNVIEPLVRNFWDIDVLKYLEEYDCDCEEYLVEQLTEIGIQFTRHKVTPRYPA